MEKLLIRMGHGDVCEWQPNTISATEYWIRRRVVDERRERAITEIKNAAAIDPTIIPAIIRGLYDPIRILARAVKKYTCLFPHLAALRACIVCMQRLNSMRNKNIEYQENEYGDFSVFSDFSNSSDFSDFSDSSDNDDYALL